MVRALVGPTSTIEPADEEEVLWSSSSNGIWCGDVGGKSDGEGVEIPSGKGRITPSLSGEGGVDGVGWSGVDGDDGAG